MKFPIRSESHQLEELSERFFLDHLPNNWAAEKPANDYGVDLRVDLFEGRHATGLELLVQLKASKKSTAGESEVVRLKVATYNLLWKKLQVDMLVKFVESEKEAYWLLFKDIPNPPQDQESFTVHIPKANRLSSAPWQKVQQYVRSVTDRKLAAMRVREIEKQ
ncbi:DUF4365 domain-containing protein [Pseudothauera nasutitermitis]|nr:DUF4365 domain-containing protein [Pseudothauera nasutitermitis]